MRRSLARRLNGGVVRYLVSLTVVAMSLSGCMSTLQTSGSAGNVPPRPLATATSVPEPQATAVAMPSPMAPGSLAPDPATSTPPIDDVSPTALPAPTIAATNALPPLSLPTAPALSIEERWRAQQQDRVIFEQLTAYTTSSSELWWYDPVNQQHVILGRVTGDFSAQARFIVRAQGVEALEVPYQVNISYGLTALSPALVERIRASGYASDWIEAYVFLTPNVFLR
jgi:hypothetical protein